MLPLAPSTPGKKEKLLWPAIGERCLCMLATLPDYAEGLLFTVRK